jgi:hypothetical protein
LLEAEDGRYYAIDKFGTGLSSIVTTERIREANVSFGLPSAPALFLSLAYKAFIAYRNVDVRGLFDGHPQGVWPDDQTPLFDFCEQFAAHIVFAFTALESLANEIIPQEHSYTTIDGKTGEPVTYNRDEIERYVSLDEKLLQVLPSALDVGSPKGLHIWRDYKKLKNLRNRIIHLKMIDRQSTGPEIKTVWGDMLRNSKIPFSDNAHNLMGHFGSTVTERRWYGKYPYIGA